MRVVGKKEDALERTDSKRVRKGGEIPLWGPSPPAKERKKRDDS